MYKRNTRTNKQFKQVMDVTKIIMHIDKGRIMNNFMESMVMLI